MALRWNHFVACLLLIAAAFFFTGLSAAGADDDDWPFSDGDASKGYQMVYVENLSLQDFFVDCKGYQNHNMDQAYDIASGYVRSNANFTLEFDRVKAWRLFEVYCTYYGADNCAAEKVKVFFAPAGDDIYYCSKYSNLVQGCGYRFQADGRVEKLTGGKNEEYIGHVPTRKNYRKVCIWKWCFRPFWWETVIGDVQCCDGACN